MLAQIIPDWLTADLARQLFGGAAVTVALVVITSVTSFVVGLLAAIGRRSRRRHLGFPQIASTFVEIFRNVPALILIIFFAFAVPNLFSASLRRTLFFANPVMEAVETVTGLPLPYYALAAVVALTCNTGAHLAEVLRAGMDAVPASRIESARSLGATARQAYFSVTIPDGIRLSFGGIANRLTHNLKNTALASFVAVPELFSEVQGAITKTFQASGLLVAAAVMYLVLSGALEFGLARVERSLWRGRPIDRRTDV